MKLSLAVLPFAALAVAALLSPAAQAEVVVCGVQTDALPVPTLLMPQLDLPQAVPPAPPTPPQDSAYAAGTRAMNDSRWSDAVAGFDQVIKAKGPRVDAALYWKAYSLNKLGKADLASATCAQLRTQYPESHWMGDCLALEITQQIGPGPSGLPPGSVHIHFDSDSHTHTTSTHTGSDPNVDMKILALNSLLHRDPAQAVPLLRGVLAGDQPAEVKKHALFVLAQSRSPEADALMRDLVMGRMGPDLQRESIQASGIYRGRRSDDALVEAYHATADPKVKKSVVSALFIANDDAHLVDLARAEKDLELKRSIVSQLALMNGKAAQDYMLELLK